MGINNISTGGPNIIGSYLRPNKDDILPLLLPISTMLQLYAYLKTKYNFHQFKYIIKLNKVLKYMVIT